MWFSCTVVSDSLQPYGLRPARLLCPWNFPGKNTRAGCHFLLQRIFPTQGSNPCLLNLLYWQGDSLPLALPEEPRLKDVLVNLPDSLITLLLNMVSIWIGYLPFYLNPWESFISLSTFMHWRRKWQPTPVFLPGESQGQRSLVGCHLRGCTESDTTEAT